MQCGLPSEAHCEKSFARLCACSKAGHPLLLTGPPGIGKTAAVRHAAKSLGANGCVRLNMSSDTTMDMLVGMLVPSAEGFHRVEGKLLEAIRKGWWVIFDEINLAPPCVRAEKICLTTLRGRTQDLSAQRFLCALSEERGLAWPASAD